MPRSYYPHTAQDSVLASPLTKKKFSLQSMPVAKLKKSSKNPFSATKAAAAKKAADPNAPPKKRGRPPKAKPTQE